MPIGLTKTKRRIASIQSTQKITKAMEMVATVKLKRYRDLVDQSEDYAEGLREVMAELFLHDEESRTHYAFENEEVAQTLYLVITSNLGLCAGYNSNIFKLAESSVGKDDDMLILGKKAISHFENSEYKTILEFSDYSSMKNEKSIEKIVNYLLDKYFTGEYKEIHVIYTSYRNSMVFVPKDYKVLPLEKKEYEEDFTSFAPILEPSEEQLLDTLIPLFIKSSVYSKLLESEVCEQAARANAMESATDNANEILEALNIEFNKARQSAITQEITEIVGAAEAI